MVSEHLCGGMVKDMYLEELNCSSFFAFHGRCSRGRGVLWLLDVVKMLKTVGDAWPPCAPYAELESADIVAVILIYLALAHIQKRATY
jgi:hypothetical protein